MADVLRQAGVERIYGVVGDSLNSVVDAVHRTDGIEWVHARNEEAAAFAAAAEAQLTGKLAVCAGSCGLGNTHPIQGLYDAHRSGAPVLAIASHIPSHQIGTGFFQETHPERLFTDCSDYCEMISTPTQMPRVLRIAMQRALGNSGVSVLVIPGDVAHDKAVNPTGAGHLVTECGPVVAPAAQVRELAGKLNAARKVMLFCGAGVRDAPAEVMALAEGIAMAAVCGEQDESSTPAARDLLLELAGEGTFRAPLRAPAERLGPGRFSRARAVMREPVAVDAHRHHRPMASPVVRG